MYELCGLLGQHNLGFFHKLFFIEIIFDKHIFFKDRKQLFNRVLNI